MYTSTILKRAIFNLTLLSIFSLLYTLIFYPIYTSNNVIISFALHPFNICEKYPDFWLKLKLIYILITFASSLIIINLIYSSIFTKKKIKKSTVSNLEGKLSLFITNDDMGYPIILPEASLYQNILITGTIRFWQNKFSNVSIYKATY